MIVSDIIAITKSRYKVVLENNIELVLYKGELNRYHIKQGEELQETEYQSIINEILPKRARLRCMNLLKARDYTRKQLEDKLRQGGYPSEIIAQAIDYVEGYGYIDDERYARNFIEYNIKKKSRTRITNDLMRKGIGKADISKAFNELEDDGIEVDEEEIIHKLLLKKNYHTDTATIDEKRKMFAFLYRKGFHSDIIRRALLLDIT
ncbi:MAG: regulatory protein RecX [Lachnospiraceae bacterium]|nr:regulatory protein RecX [Lachnospiraceae bacterium]